MESGGVAVVTLDLVKSPVNTLGRTFSNELPPIFEKLEKDPAVKSILIISAKGDFMAGADITLFGEVAQRGKEAIKNELSKPAQDLFNKMAAGKPKVAAISGPCLGGGAEFALACHYRVASIAPSTQIGFPEVMLGILPGAGGTQRLPLLVGVQNALPMLLQGGAKKPKQAKTMGLIDMTCEKEQLYACGLTCAQQIAAGKLKIPKRGEFKGMNKYVEKAIQDYSFVRDYVIKTAKKQVMKASGGNYPAPLKILEVMQRSLDAHALGKAKGYDIEADSFADLALTPESAGLKAVFFGQTALKKNPFKGAKPVNNMVVMGAGLMGAGIAEVSIAKGFTVAMKDLSREAVQRGEKIVQDSYAKKIAKKKTTAWDANIVLSRLTGLSNDMDYWPIHFKKADIVIEAVFEDIKIKHQTVKDVEAVTGPNCIFATNTSSLPVSEIAKASKRPENVVGMHYFSPVTAMQLLEVIPHAGTSPEVIATAVGVGLKQGKLPIVVKDVPGFFVNRCLGPYIDESMVLAFEVENYMQLDKAIKAFGFPVGPMLLADEVGIEVAFHLHKNLRADLQERVGGANVAAMEAILGAGLKGKRFGSGFLSYPTPAKKGGMLDSVTGMFGSAPKITPNKMALDAMRPYMKAAKVSDEDIQKRIVARFVNEAIFCLQDGVIRNAVDGDMASIFGVGFPPFTGGPFRYIDSVGAGKYCDHLKQLADQHGPRFAPAPLLVDMAKGNKKFHPA